MPRTAFTASEWQEFCEGFDDPDDAWEVLCLIWERERRDDLNAIREFCSDEESKDLWVACFKVAGTDSHIFHEIEDRLRQYLWVNSPEYRDYCKYLSEVRAE